MTEEENCGCSDEETCLKHWQEYQNNMTEEEVKIRLAESPLHKFLAPPKGRNHADDYKEIFDLTIKKLNEYTAKYMIEDSNATKAI